MADELKINGTNAILTVDDEKVRLERKKGLSILDYLGSQVTEIQFSELKRCDLRRPNLFQPGYFRFVKKNENVPEGEVSARKLAYNRQAIVLDMAGSTNVLDLDKVYDFINKKIAANQKNSESPEK